MSYVKCFFVPRAIINHISLYLALAAGLREIQGPTWPSVVRVGVNFGSPTKLAVLDETGFLRDCSKTFRGRINSFQGSTPGSACWTRMRRLFPTVKWLFAFT